MNVGFWNWDSYYRNHVVFVDPGQVSLSTVLHGVQYDEASSLQNQG